MQFVYVTHILFFILIRVQTNVYRTENHVISFGIPIALVVLKTEKNVYIIQTSVRSGWYKCIFFYFQLVTVTCTPNIVALTWNSTSCPDTQVAASAGNVVIRLKGDSATTAKRGSIGTSEGISHTGKHVKVCDL